MLENQKQLFNLDPEVTYLNCATFSPQLKSVERIGIETLKVKSNPQQIRPHHFFENRSILKDRFAQLIKAPNAESISIIPAVSYGMASAIKNIPFEKGDEVILLEEQFPSNFYSWKSLEQTKGVRLRIVSAPKLAEGRARQWNEKLLETINPKTRAISIPQVHWSDGTLFNLKDIRTRSKDVGAYLILDGTQSIGAVPFSVEEIRPDALICGGYKWLMGAYGMGLAYFGERFDDGIPVEDNWINHASSDDFTNLVNYNDHFRPGAARYDVGESSNFIHVAMLSEGIRQLLDWTPEAIQNYCKHITGDLLSDLSESGFFVDESSLRAHHIFGIYDTRGAISEEIKQRLKAQNIVVSFRGKAIRVSPHVYNTRRDIEKLVSCFK